MRTLITAIALAYGALGVWLADTSRAQQPEKFTVKICNQSGSAAVVAVTVQTQPNLWRVRGWYGVANQQCNSVGTYLGPAFYFVAISEDRVVWQAEKGDKTAVWECVLPEAFDYQDGKYPNKCNDGAVFHFIKIPAGTVPTLK